MTVGRGRPCRLFAGLPRAEGEVGLEPEDRPDALGLGLLVEAPRGVEIPVVGDREAVHPELLDVAHQIGDPVGPVEQGVFAVGVEVDEGHDGLTAHLVLFSSSPAPRRARRSGTSTAPGGGRAGRPTRPRPASRPPHSPPRPAPPPPRRPSARSWGRLGPAVGRCRIPPGVRRPEPRWWRLIGSERGRQDLRRRPNSTRCPAAPPPRRPAARCPPARLPARRSAAPPAQSTSGSRYDRPARSAPPGTAPRRRHNPAGSRPPAARGPRSHPCARGSSGNGCSSGQTRWKACAPEPPGRRTPASGRPRTGAPGPPRGPIRRDRTGQPTASCSRTPGEPTGDSGDCQNPLSFLILLHSSTPAAGPPETHP